MNRLLTKDKAAEADLIGIWLYSFEKWGEAQADRYLDSIEAGVLAIARTPESGRCRGEVRDGFWSAPIARHVAFYTFSDAEVRLRRILHGAMDVARNLAAGNLWNWS